MPGSWARVAPFLQRLPTLSAGQKAAVVNLGIFPDSNAPAFAYAAPPPAVSSIASSSDTNRPSSINALLPAKTPTPIAPPQQTNQTNWQPPRAVQVAYSRPPIQASAHSANAVFQPKIWLQLGSGADTGELASRFQRMKAKSPDLFEGIKPYVAQSGDGSRLVIGPFRGSSDAELFAEDLESIGVSPMKWTNSQADRIAPLPAE
jgi:hypothetical protein